MSNGLNIKTNEFESLPQKQQMKVLYENTEELKRMITNYKFHQKFQYAIIGLLCVAFGLTKYLGVI